MNAWLTARRVKKGKEEEFRRKWRGNSLPEGMVDAFLLEDEEDPRETLSVSLWDSAEKLLAYRTGEEANKRRETLSDIVDRERWSRSFVGWNEWELAQKGGKKKLLMLPLLLAAAGAGAFFFLKRRNQEKDLDWDTWEPEPAGTYQPAAPVTATAAPASPQMPPPAVRPLESTPRTGDGGSMAASGAAATGEVHTARAPETGGHTHMAQTPANTSNLTSGGSSPPAGSAASGRGSATASGASAGASAGAAAATRSSAQGGRTVRDLMTANPETVDTRTDVATAAERMRTLDVGVLPVMAEGRLAGVVTDRDLALGMAERSMKPSMVIVSEFMTEAPVTVRPDTSVEEAAKLMAEHQIRRLPVVDGTKLVGMLSLGDLAADGAEKAATGALEQISEPASPDR